MFKQNLKKPSKTANKRPLKRVSVGKPRSATVQKQKVPSDNEESSRQRSIELGQELLHNMIKRNLSEKVIQRQIGLIGTLLGKPQIITQCRCNLRLTF